MILFSYLRNVGNGISCHSLQNHVSVGGWRWCSKWEMFKDSGESLEILCREWKIIANKSCARGPAVIWGCLHEVSPIYMQGNVVCSSCCQQSRSMDRTGLIKARIESLRDSESEKRESWQERGWAHGQPSSLRKRKVKVDSGSRIENPGLRRWRNIF